MDETKRLFVVAGLPPAMRKLIGEPQLSRLLSAHPDVAVRVVEEQAEFAALAARADGLILMPPLHIPAACFAPGAPLRWVQSVPAGVDWLLTPELVAAAQVVVTASKGPMGPLMAEHVVLLLLALARNLPFLLQEQAERRWQGFLAERPIRQLYGKTIAILGVGAVGGALARICQVGFGMRVLGMARTRQDNPHVDRYFSPADLHAALAEADAVALCLPQTAATERMIDAAALAAMKPTAYLVNIARGGLVDEEALVDALRSGRLAGAGLDATAVEPLPADSPLWTLPNVIITPHIAPGRDRLGEHLVGFWCENIRRFAGQQPLQGVVDRAAGY